MDNIKIEETLVLIGLRIKKRRLKEKLTQKELGKKSGIAETTIVQIEKGRCKPTHFVLYKLSRVFNITIDELVYENIDL